MLEFGPDLSFIRYRTELICSEKHFYDDISKNSQVKKAFVCACVNLQMRKLTNISFVDLLYISTSN